MLPTGPAEMFRNVFILMECYLKLSPDVDHSDFTCNVCCFQLVDIASKLNWYSEAKTVAEMLVLNLKIEKIHLQTNALMTYMFTNTEQRYNE